MNWIAVRQNGNGEGKTDKYMVNNTQKGNKQQRVANQTEEEKEYENKMRNDLEHMRNRIAKSGSSSNLVVLLLL